MTRNEELVRVLSNWAAVEANRLRDIAHTDPTHENIFALADFIVAQFDIAPEANGFPRLEFSEGSNRKQAGGALTSLIRGRLTSWPDEIQRSLIVHPIWDIVVDHTSTIFVQKVTPTLGPAQFPGVTRYTQGADLIWRATS